MNKMMNKKGVLLIAAAVLSLILALCVYERTNELVEELTCEELLIHYGDGSTKLLTSEMPDFSAVGNSSLRVVKSIDMQLRMPVPADLSVNNTYVELIFPETVTIRTKYDTAPHIELDAALLMLTGDYRAIIFTGKRGYINWTDDTGYFVEEKSKNVRYMSAWTSGESIAGLRNHVERLK